MAGVKKEDQTLLDLEEDTDPKSRNEIDPPSMQMSVWLLLTILSTVDMMEIVRATAIEYLGLDFSTTCDDITTLKFIARDSLLSLKHACETEKIGCFLQCVFKESGAANVLGRGNFRWKLHICKTSPEEYSRYRQLIETKEEQKQIWGLFAEELDPTELFRTFQDMGLVGEKEKDKMMLLISRKEKLDYLIGRLVRKKGPDQGFKILLAHSVKNDYEFLSKINEIYGGDSNFRRKRIEEECLPGQKLFTASVTLKIHDNALGFEWEKKRVQLAKQFDWLKEEMCEPDIKEVASNTYKDVRPNIFEFIWMLDYPSWATMEMKVLKQYNLLKDELYWPDIISITDNLYNNGDLDYFEMSKIQDRSQPRRKVTDMLLKVVLGNPSTMSAFMRILESESRLSYIAERINSTQISTEEIKRFQRQEGILLEQRKNIPRPNQNFHISFADVGTLICSLDEDVIDEIRDLLLSKFLISIHDHTRIFDCAHMEGKILQLIDLMKKGPDGIYDVFEEVFNKNNLEFVLQNLERNQMLKMKRKSLSCDVDNSPVQKRIKINHNQQGSASDAVEKMVSSLRNATVRQKLTGHVRKHMGLELKQTFKGSSGILLTFNFMEPSQKLKHPFTTDPKECAEC